MPSLQHDWIPRPRTDVDIWSLDLGAEEGFVLSRIDGATPLGRLPFLTGLGADRVSTIVEGLVGMGVLTAPEPGEDTTAVPRTPASPERSSSSDAEGGGWRRHFERELRPLSVDQRCELAQRSEGDELRALCFDPHPKVAMALVESTGFGLEHARLLARHHRSSQGLTALGRSAAFLRDQQVIGELFRNPQTPEALLDRILRGRNLHQLHALAVGHNATERVRKSARRSFRRDFMRSSAEECVNLILKTEGRCLSMLSGVALDGRTAALLCRRRNPDKQICMSSC
ncbi:MAG: hypothetical protein AAGN66_13745 [Acidobacteriota bacterium]